MNKPIQVLEPSKLFAPDASGVVNRSSSEDGASSFSSILIRSKGEPNAPEGGDSLPVSGNKLPEQAPVDEQPSAGDVSPVTMEQADASMQEEMPEEPILAVTLELQETGTVQSPLQLTPEPDVLPIYEAGIATVTADAEQPVTDAESAPAAIAGQQAQAQDVDIRFLAKSAPGSPAVSNEQLQQKIIHDAGGTRAMAVSYLTIADAGRVSSDSEATPNVVREAVQMAITNQAPGRDLEQFLRQNRNHQPASNILQVSSSAETTAVPFMQAISDTALVMPSARIQVPVGQPGWGQALGEQLVWFVSQNISSASLRLNPQHLGPMEMEVSMNGDKASVSFTSQQGLVREALESSIPRLREMLSENGLNLVNVNVSQQGNSHRNGQGADASRDGAGVANSESDTSESSLGPGVRQTTIVSRGLVDFYA